MLCLVAQVVSNSLRPHELYVTCQAPLSWRGQRREACRDQMEGYHYRYEQDADPRRAPAPAAPACSRATSPGSGL